LTNGNLLKVGSVLHYASKPNGGEEECQRKKRNGKKIGKRKNGKKRNGENKDPAIQCFCVSFLTDKF
jgi:hypothetical protein